MVGHEAPGALGTIADYTRPHLLMLAASGFLRLVNVCVGVTLLGLAGGYVGGVIADGLTVTVRQWALFVSLGVTKALARYLEQVTGHVAAFRILDTLRGQIYEWFSGRTTRHRAASTSGDIVSRAMADVELVEVFFAHTLVPVVVAVPVIFALSGFVAWIAGAATGVALGVLLVAAGLLVPLVSQRLNSGLAEANRAASGRLSADVAESLAGLTDIVTSGAQDTWVRRISARDEALSESNAGLALRNAVREMTVDLLLVAALFIVTLGAVEAGAPVTVVWAMTCAVAGSFGVVLAINRAIDDLPRSAAAAARILEIEYTPESTFETPGPDRAPSPASLDVAFTNVTIDFGKSRGLRTVSLVVPHGTHLFIAGRSGAGKSTLARLVLGLERPDYGKVLLGGEPLETLDPSALRTLVSGSMQRAGLVRGTVLANVAIGSRRGLGQDDALPTDLTAAEQSRANSVAGFADLCENLSRGEGTIIGGTHEELSGGQQRRLAIARMVTRDPSIVVLDEAFVGLDRVSAHDLRNSVLSWARRERRTIIEVSHELEYAFEADRVVVIHDGLVVEDGPPESLMKQQGVFATMAGE